MSDIIHDLEGIGCRGGVYHTIAQRAKREIEQLRAENARLRTLVEHYRLEAV